MFKFLMNVFLIVFVSLLAAQSPLEENITSFKDTTEVKKTDRDIIYPNPTYGIVQFDLSRYDYKDFRVVVKNIIAKEIWSKSFNTRKFEEDFGFLDKGTYVLAVENIDGYTLFSRRLIIITP